MGDVRSMTVGELLDLVGRFREKYGDFPYIMLWSDGSGRIEKSPCDGVLMEWEDIDDIPPFVNSLFGDQ